MTRKITEANNMAKAGLKIFFVNGNKPKRITDAVSGKKFEEDFILGSNYGRIRNFSLMGNDNPIGKEEKVKCHLPNGKLHRAFTALIFNNDGKLLLTKRSDSKMLWPVTGMEQLLVILERGNIRIICRT